MDQNERFKIAEIPVGSGTETVYLLNPGDVFAGFGCSSRGLLVRKTASLIVRSQGAFGVEDVEHNLADKTAWARIFKLAADAAKKE